MSGKWNSSFVFTFYFYFVFVHYVWFCSESCKIGALEKLQTDMFSNYVQQPSVWRDVSRTIRPPSNFFISAASWQNQQKWLCAQWRLRSAWASAQSDQSSLSARRKLGSLATFWAHSEDWSDWVDAQADLSLRWAHMRWFCLEAAHLSMTSLVRNVTWTIIVHRCMNFRSPKQVHLWQ